MTGIASRAPAPGRRAVGTAVRATALALAVAASAAAQGRGVQLVPDGSGRVLVNKDVGNERYAITLNEDGTVSGNVFRADGSLVFLFCEPQAVADTYRCSAADPCVTAGGAVRGIQRSPDAARVLVNKDVGGERFAITLHPDGSATGNVFRAAGGSPAFIYCAPLAAAQAFACVGADACVSDTCIEQYVALGDVTLPADFFTVPAPCGAAFTFVDDVILPGSFFVPPASEGDTRCCLPDDGASACEDRTPAVCASQGGVDLGPGACTPDACAGQTPPPDGVIRVRCERRAGRSQVSVDGSNLAAGSYGARITSGANSATAALRATLGDEVEFDFDSDPDDVASGATAIAATFIQGVPPAVTGAVLTPAGATVAEATVVCDEE